MLGKGHVGIYEDCMERVPVLHNNMELVRCMMWTCLCDVVMSIPYNYSLIYIVTTKFYEE